MTGRPLKRLFDIAVSFVALAVCAPIILLAVLVQTVDTGQWGIFSQLRVGRDGRTFRVYKVRTMAPAKGSATTITTSGDARITRLGRFLRRTKIDELPQFWNVLKGDMSVVGPRPDVPGYADELRGPDRVILSVRPGVTGPAAVYFRDEERLLASQPDPERYNDEVLWPKKVRINRAYVEHYGFLEDLRLIADTAFPFLKLSWASRMREADDREAAVLSGIEETRVQEWARRE